ncbi:Protein bfr2 [Penicillium diatomitis]|uniref:Protein BFR2 n=1 Tax=Penicillium diatomitis TaxID=2819901 RepID=A0A9W9X5G9_9EURO|nr:Protein bfr2 [Penicillium diatomitis]KAJ5484171.1 Protein bfr2 [Penicillium diatomitis]
MAPEKARPARSLADQLADLEDPTPKDFDPEDIERDVDSIGDDGPKNPSDVTAGREHYQSVGKGKLRKSEPADLGKQYAGARVSRDQLEAESDDDPFAAHSGDESASASDEDDFGSIAETSNSEIDGDEQEELSDEEEEDDDDDEDYDSEEEGSDTHTRGPSSVKPKINGAERPAASNDDRDELRRLMASDQKTIAATISQAAKADAAKGKAVKQQRSTFDALLNTRIKLQKGMGAINQMAGAVAETKEANGSENADKTNSEAIKSAEEAALALWSTLEGLRIALADAHNKDGVRKRKRLDPVSNSTSAQSLWQRMSDLEADSVLHRRAVLDKWSSKVRGPAASLPNARGKLLGSASGTQTITAVLDAHVATEMGDRASKRARPGTAPTGNSPDESQEAVYDDTVFYQSLLRDLVEQRMASEAMTGGLDTLQQMPSRLPIHPITGMRNDKNRKEVDTRASKGRKMRFNVHEKLQNFMAPEDRGSWTVRARDEFFASLLGKSASGLLGEGDDSASEAESDEDREEGGLRLFRG